MDDLDKTILILKYPDYKNWRDKSTIKNGYWPDGTIAQISDPEFQPNMDELITRILDEPGARDKFLKDMIGSESMYIFLKNAIMSD